MTTTTELAVLIEASPRFRSDSASAYFGELAATYGPDHAGIAWTQAILKAGQDPSVHYRLVTEYADGTRAADPRHFATAEAAQAEVPRASETITDAVVVIGKRMMSGSWWHSLTGAQWYASPEAAAAAETVSEAAERHDEEPFGCQDSDLADSYDCTDPGNPAWGDCAWTPETV